jgi:hypothetical protein
MPLPWSPEILPETIALGLAMAICASLLGAWIGARLSADDLPYAQTAHLRLPAVAAALAIFAMLAFPLFTKSDSDVSASVALTNVHSGPQRTVKATVTLTPRDAADHAKWLTITSWQGDGHLTADRLTRVAEGVYRSNRAVPVYGEWKTMIRLHVGRSILGLPIYAPEDRAIPVAGVAAPARFTRNFQSDHKLLQREAKTQDQTITYAAYGTVLFFALLLLAMLAWGLHRVGTTAGRERAGAGVPEVESPRDDGDDANGAQAASGSEHRELPEWARPPAEAGRETAGSGAGR